MNLKYEYKVHSNFFIPLDKGTNTEEEDYLVKEKFSLLK